GRPTSLCGRSAAINGNAVIRSRTSADFMPATRLSPLSPCPIEPKVRTIRLFYTTWSPTGVADPQEMKLVRTDHPLSLRGAARRRGNLVAANPRRRDCFAALAMTTARGGPAGQNAAFSLFRGDSSLF